MKTSVFAILASGLLLGACATSGAPTQLTSVSEPDRFDLTSDYKPAQSDLQDRMLNSHEVTEVLKKGPFPGGRSPAPAGTSR
tara:strand:- start:270 stop:515 length:246 start_codon:yes stop_codon:yes gene_type:complete